MNDYDLMTPNDVLVLLALVLLAWLLLVLVVRIQNPTNVRLMRLRGAEWLRVRSERGAYTDVDRADESEPTDESAERPHEPSRSIIHARSVAR